MMKRDITIPQGTYKIGRDLHEGVYLIAGLSELTFIYIKGPDDKYGRYTLDEEDGMIAHVELANEASFEVTSRVILRQVANSIEDDKCTLFDEIANFENDLRARGVKIKTLAPPAKTPTPTAKPVSSSNTYKSTPTKKQGGSFWDALASLFDTSPSSSSSFSSFTSKPMQKKQHSGKCDGDCANCPPHYGYRHGRWYYGHDHVEGCEFGGNKGSGSKD